MTLDSIVEYIASMPDAMKMGDKSYWKIVCGGMLPGVVDDVAMAYDWEFLFDRATVAVTSGTSEYTLTGNGFNLRDIQDIRYGSDALQLVKYRPLDALDYISDNAPTDVVGWYQTGTNQQGYPVIKIFGTPTTSTTMSVRFRKKDVKFVDFPDMFQNLFIAGLLSGISGERNRDYQAKMKMMIKRAKVGGKDFQRISADPQIIAGNRKIASLYTTG